MNHPQLDHVGIAVNSIDDSLILYQEILGIETGPREQISSQKVSVQFLETGQTKTELLEPTSEDSPIANFLKKRGPGLHHIAYKVENLQHTMSKLKDAGSRLIYPEPRPGSHGTRINFIHPSSTGGILIELVEYPGKEAGKTSGEEHRS
ncbi:MAG: methylmalonyl-CoA epimerase [Planctomycetota bacterium]